MMSLVNEVKALQWLEPWALLGGGRALELEKELRRELSWKHDLSGRRCVAVALRGDQDDVAFVVDSSSLAIVHLTWSVETGPDFPRTRELSVAEFVAQMRLDHDDFMV